MLYGQYGIITFELLRRGIDPGSFGFENFLDFVDVIPSLKKCMVNVGKRVIPGTVIRILPDANVEKNELHSVYVLAKQEGKFVVADETGIYSIDREELYRYWKRAGMKYMRCTK